MRMSVFRIPMQRVSVLVAHPGGEGEADKAESDRDPSEDGVMAEGPVAGL